MSEYTWRELERADMDTAAAHAAEMEYRAEQIADEAQKRLARAEHIVDGLGEVKGEIVRCRDCRHIVWTDNPMTRTHYWCIENDHPNALDDFCSLAERREDGGIESIYDWEWVREMVGEEEAERRKEQQREEESE